MADGRPPFRVFRAYFRLPPMPGGMELHVAELTRAQRALGVDVTLLHQCGESVGASVRILPMWPLNNVRPAALRDAAFYVAASIASGLRTSGPPIVLHVHGDWSAFFMSRLLAKRLGAKLTVASIHGSIMGTPDWVYQAALLHCQLVFTTGSRDSNCLETILGRKVHHLPSAPRHLFFDNTSRTKIFAFDVIGVGSFTRNKRLDLFLECAANRPDLRFAVFGDGPNYPEIRELALRRGLQNLHMPGRAEPEEIAAALRSARLFLSTAESEGTPTAALEAMAIGLPVLLTPSNNYDWLIRADVEGLVTSGWEVGEILSALDGLLEDESRRQLMGEAARARAAQFSWKGNAERVSALMAEALGVAWQE